MRNLIVMAALSAAVALPLAIPAQSEAASCSSRKATGTVLGGVGGALLGGAVTHGSAGPIVGGIGGALVGREVGKSGCRKRVAYRAPARYAPARYAPSRGAPAVERAVYYDRYGRVVSSGPIPASYRVASNCSVVTRDFYDERGRLVQRATQICDR